VDIIEAEQVREEAAVEFCRLQHPRDVLVAAGVQDVVQCRFRVPPAADVHGGRACLQIGDEVHLSLRHVGTAPAAA
jgi:hypothetical protein